MKTIELFVIRDTLTGGYLPPGNGHNGRGSTYQEVCIPDQHRLPRFFPDRETALRCLRAWLRGIYEGEGGGEEGRWWSSIKKQPHRIAENMEIVPITITLP